MVSRVSQPWLTKRPSQQDQVVCCAFHTVLCFRKIEVPPPQRQMSHRYADNMLLLVSVISLVLDFST